MSITDPGSRTDSGPRLEASADASPKLTGENAASPIVPLAYAKSQAPDLRRQLRRVNFYRNLLQWVLPVFVLGWIVIGYSFTLKQDQKSLRDVLGMAGMITQFVSMVALPVLTVLLELAMGSWVGAIVGGLMAMVPFVNLFMAVRDTRLAEQYLQANGYWRLGYDQPERGQAQ